MSASKKGLGRGFDSLIPAGLIDDSFDPNSVYDPTSAQDLKVSQEKTLPLSKLVANPGQPRRNFDEVAIKELSASIKEHGVIQPIVVTPKGDHFEIVAGERRYRASKLAGLEEIPVIIRELTDQNQLEISLIENIQRRDLNAIETATAYAKLRDQFNLSNDQIAGRVHKSPSAVINTMRLLKLPKNIIELIAEGKLSQGQARPLIGQDEKVLVEIVPKIIAESWSARKIEQYLVNLKNSAGSQEGNSNSPVENSHEREIKALRDRLETKVEIRTNQKGAGKIVINFKSEEDLKRIQDILG